MALERLRIEVVASVAVPSRGLAVVGQFGTERVSVILVRCTGLVLVDEVRDVDRLETPPLWSSPRVHELVVAPVEEFASMEEPWPRPGLGSVEDSVVGSHSDIGPSRLERDAFSLVTNRRDFGHRLHLDEPGRRIECVHLVPWRKLGDRDRAVRGDDLGISGEPTLGKVDT